MRVVFFGTPQFAVPSLAALRASGVDVAAVVTQPDRPRTRSHSQLLPTPVKDTAAGAGIPVWQPDRPRGDAFERLLRDAHADIGVVVAYGHLLPAGLIAIPRLGFVNVHASLLPRWRGAAPIQWALLSGDRETGVSIMRVEAGLDSGAVWHRRVTPIADHDTSGTLHQRLAELGAQALLETLPRVASGEAPVPQGEPGSHAPKIDRTIAHVDWNEPARAVSCRIRAMDPSPGAWTAIAGTELKLFGPLMAPARSLAALPGAITAQSTGALTVRCGDADIVIKEVQPAGKRRITAAEWLRGAHLPEGARFA